MATKASSDKIFGGTQVLAGNYFIKSATIEERVIRDGDPYDSLELILCEEVAPAIPGAAPTIGNECTARLALNGCWRARRGDDGKAYQSAGSFITSIIAACHGLTFSKTRDFINGNYANKRIAVSYTRYPALDGRFGQVVNVELI